MYVFLVGTFIGPSNAEPWLISLAINVGCDILILQTMKIWINSIVKASIVQEEVRAILGLLRKKSFHIMTKSKGILTGYNSLIQHFNPVCRFSRMCPQIPVCRLFALLNDNDLPVDAFLGASKAVVSKHSVFAYLYLTVDDFFRIICVCVILPLSLLPEVLEESFNEAIITFLLAFATIFAQYLVTSTNLILTCGLLFVVGLLLALRERGSSQARRRQPSAFAKVVNHSNQKVFNEYLGNRVSVSLRKTFISALGWRGTSFREKEIIPMESLLLDVVKQHDKKSPKSFRNTKYEYDEKYGFQKLDYQLSNDSFDNIVLLNLSLTENKTDVRVDNSSFDDENPIRESEGSLCEISSAFQGNEDIHTQNNAGVFTNPLRVSFKSANENEIFSNNKIQDIDTQHLSFNTRIENLIDDDSTKEIFYFNAMRTSILVRDLNYNDENFNRIRNNLNQEVFNFSNESENSGCYESGSFGISREEIIDSDELRHVSTRDTLTPIFKFSSFRNLESANSIREEIISSDINSSSQIRKYTFRSFAEVISNNLARFSIWQRSITDIKKENNNQEWNPNV
jgi:hypothetical protein